MFWLEALTAAPPREDTVALGAERQAWGLEEGVKPTVG